MVALVDRRSDKHENEEDYKTQFAVSAFTFIASRP